MSISVTVAVHWTSVTAAKSLPPAATVLLPMLCTISLNRLWNQCTGKQIINTAHPLMRR